MTGGKQAEREEFSYYVVESCMVARAGRGTTERLTREGTWVPYDDRWRVLTEGRRLENEAKALQMARELFAQEDGWEARSEGDAPEREGAS